MNQRMLAGALALAGALLLSGCTARTGAVSDPEPSPSAQTGADRSDLFTDGDMEVGYDAATAVSIQLEGESARCDSDAVAIEGSTVTILDEGTYLLSGTLTDGTVIVNGDDTDKVRLVLDGAEIHSSEFAALYVYQADKVFVTLAQDSVNTLSNGGSYVTMDENNVDAALFAKSDLTLNGAGSLTIRAEAGHGVVTKDDLVITSGSYDITSASQGLSGKDSVRIADGTFAINSGKDGIQSDNPEDSEKGYVYVAGGSFAITSGGDGLSASSWMEVDGGTFELCTGGGAANGETHTSQETAMGPGGRVQPGSEAAAETGTADTAAEDADSVSTKGLKAGTSLQLNGGAFTTDCADDSFHSNGTVTVAGGDYRIATGDDAFHADDALTVQGGSITVTESYEGLEGLTVLISGGTIDLVSDDDGVNAAGGQDQSGFGGGRAPDAFAADSGASITIAGGTLTVDASGDGLDSNGSLTVSGGEVYVSSAGSGDSALDCDGEAVITGGVVVAVGGAQMAQNFGQDSTQGAMLVTVSTQQAGSTVSLADSAGTELVCWQPGHSYDSVLISCPELQEGETYLLTAGESQTQVTLDSLIYGSGGMGQGGGRSGGGSLGGGSRPEGEAAPQGSPPQRPEDGAAPPELPEGQGTAAPAA